MNQNQDHWELRRAIEKVWNRLQNTVRFVSVNTVDDTQPTQAIQTTGLAAINEVRNLTRIQHIGHNFNPTIGSTGIVLNGVATDMGQGIMISTEDARYRIKNIKQGEHVISMIDGPSAKDGSGGTARAILQGLQGWLTTLFGKTITLGDSNNTTIVIGSSGNTTSIDIYGKTEVTIHGPKIVCTNGGTPSPVETVAGPSTVLSADA